MIDLWQTGCEDWKLPKGCTQMDSCWEHGNKTTDSIMQDCQVTLVTSLCCGTQYLSVLRIELLHVTFLVP